MPRNASKNQALSPPAHLPTPLPEVPLLAPEPLAASSALDHLIDFESDTHYTSPPFREAQLPDEYDRPETPPLPIPPRIHAHYHEEDELETPYVTNVGHTRTPTVPSHPTRLESISRTIKTYTPQSASVIKSSASAALRTSADALRTYVPSSIHIPVPSVGPSPPMVSRPLSYGRFSVDPELPRQDSPYQQEDSMSFEYPRQHHEATALPSRPPSGVTRALGFDAMSSYPHYSSGNTHADAILWARWDTISHRRVLIIGYTSGIQIWDCSDLGSVTEILNLTTSSEEWRLDVVGRTVNFNSFVRAAVLPPSSDCRGDLLANHRPFLGILLSTSDSPSHSALFIYSLKTHQIVQRIALPGIASTFESNNHFIIISVTSPPTVYILSASTFHTLWTLSSASLAAFSPVSSVSLAGQTPPIDQPPKPPPTPVFALSGRLLAYASPSPHQSRRISTSSAGSGPSLSSTSSSPFGFTQSELGNAAIKVGGSMLSGMKFLGGIAYEAAKNRIAESGGVSPSPGTRFFSRSAPTDERAFSNTTSDGRPEGKDKDKDKVVAPHTNPTIESGYYVTVLDLSPLLEVDDKPVKIAEFVTSRSQSVAKLAFSKDGCSLISVPENGQVTRVFRIRPQRAEGDSKAGDGVRLYDLRRGRTSVLVESLESTRDGRWVAIGTRNRTVHVFPTNPFGGRPDVVGHLQGKVKNTEELPLYVEVAPLVRLRPLKSLRVEQYRAPLAFAFVHPGDVRVPTSLLAQPLPKYDPTSSPPMSPNRMRRAGNVQDLLVFDPADGTLSLRRIVCDQRPHDQLSLASVSTTAMGVVSRSMPGAVGSPVRLSASPGAVSRTSSTSTTAGGGTVPSGSGGQEVVMDLIGQGAVMATWNLQRKRDWEEIRKPVNGTYGFINLPKEVFGADWLAQAELSTCSRSPRILPRSLYLSHQFTFWSLGEDYHALLRQYHFDVRGTKIHVRREVQVSVGVGLNTTSDRFVEDLDFHHASSSFDEPLASALAGDLITNYANSIPAVLPMYPNGISGAHSSSLKTPAFIRNSIPIRRLGDGMSEGFGRIRREISSSYHRNKVRSPSLGPRRDGEDNISVPLEFDEEDEDFLGVPRSADDVGTRSNIAVATGISAESGTSGTSASAIDVAPPTPEAEDLWKGWESREVGQAVEEVERFDDISVVGFLDEEHQKEKEVRERARAQEMEGSVRVKGKKGKKGKKMGSHGGN